MCCREDAGALCCAWAWGEQPLGYDTHLRLSLSLQFGSNTFKNEIKSLLHGGGFYTALPRSLGSEFFLCGTLSVVSYIWGTQRTGEHRGEEYGGRWGWQLESRIGW